MEYWKPLSVILVPPPALVIFPVKSTPEIELFAAETVEETVGAAQVGTVGKVLEYYKSSIYKVP